MSNHKARIAKLETAQGMGKRNKYMCLISEGWAKAFNTPQENEGQYKIQPYMQSAGGTGGEPFYLATEQELKDFAARPDVELTLIVVGSEDPEESEPQPGGEPEET